jgi:hypothetical protein
MAGAEWCLNLKIGLEVGGHGKAELHVSEAECSILFNATIAILIPTNLMWTA